MTAGLAQVGDHSGVVGEQVAGAAARALRSTETAYVTLASIHRVAAWVHADRSDSVGW